MNEQADSYVRFPWGRKRIPRIDELPPHRQRGPFFVGDLVVIGGSTMMWIGDRWIDPAAAEAIRMEA